MSLKDSALHVLVAAPVCALAVWATTPWGFMATANGFFWFGREWAQKPSKPSKWSKSKHIEWILPTVVGAVAAYVSHRYL